jgi:hypothetical protein
MREMDDRRAFVPRWSQMDTSEHKKAALLGPCFPLRFLVRPDYRSAPRQQMAGFSDSANFHRWMDLFWTPKEGVSPGSGPSSSSFGTVCPKAISARTRVPLMNGCRYRDSGRTSRNWNLLSVLMWKSCREPTTNASAARHRLPTTPAAASLSPRPPPSSESAPARWYRDRARSRYHPSRCRRRW